MPVFTILSLVLIAGFSTAFFFDSLIAYARFTTGIVGKNAVGSYFMQLLLLGSRFSVVLLMPAAAAMIDTGISTKTLLIEYGIAGIFSVLSNLFLVTYKMKYLEMISSLTGKFLGTVIEYDFTSARNKKVFNKKIKYLMVVVSITNAIGLSFPMIMASRVTDWKLLVSHLGSLINVIATIITVVYIEGIFTKLLERHPRVAGQYVNILVFYKSIGLLSFSFFCLLFGFLIDV